MTIRILFVLLPCLLSLAGQANCCAQVDWSLKNSSEFTPPPTTQLPTAKPNKNQFGSAAKQKPAPPANARSSRATGRATRLSVPASTAANASKKPVVRSTVSQSSAGHVDLDTCFVSFIDDVELPAQESGALREMYVKEGESFKKGKVVARIDDQLYRRLLEQARLQLNMAQKEATNTTAIRAAKYKVKLATVEADKARSLASKGSKSASEYRRAKYSQQVAVVELEAAEFEQGSALDQSQLEQAKVEEVKERIRRHAITTNFDGHVIEKYRDAGEWVQSGEKVLRVARMDRLYVQGNIPSDELNPFEVANKPVTVTLMLARDQKVTFEGKIVSVGLEKQGSNLFMVKAEVQNRPEQGYWTLLPGSQVKMRIHLNGAESGTSLGAVTSPGRSNR